MKLKKLLLVGGIVALGFAFVGSKYFSYAKNELRALAEKTATPEREIERLRDEVKKLDKVENDIKNELAKEIVLSEKLDRQTKELAKKVEAERQETLAFAENIKQAKGQVSYGKISMSIDDAKRKLKADSVAVQKRADTLKNMEGSLVNREEAKTLLTRQLNEVMSLKQELTNELDAIEVEYKALKLQAMKNKYHRDDSDLSNIRDGIEKLKDKIAEKRVRVGLDTGKGKIDGPVSESIDDIIAPLSGKKVSTEPQGD